MHIITCRREEAFVLGGTIRILVLHHDRDRIRLGIAMSPEIDVAPGEIPPRRRDLIAWHPDPQALVRQIAERFPAAADDVRAIRTGVAYFGTDLCLYSLLEAYTWGHADACRCFQTQPSTPP